MENKKIKQETETFRDMDGNLIRVGYYYEYGDSDNPLDRHNLFFFESVIPEILSNEEADEILQAVFSYLGHKSNGWKPKEIPGPRAVVDLSTFRGGIPYITGVDNWRDMQRFYGPKSVCNFRPMSLEDVQREIERDRESVKSLEKSFEETGDEFYKKRREEVLGKISFYGK